MEHRCRRGEDCRHWDKLDDGSVVGAPIESATGLCEACERQVHRAIAELPDDYVALNIVLGKGSTVGGEPVRMTREPALPLRLHIEALQRDMVRETALWAAAVADELHTHFTPDGGARPGWLLDRACALLTARTDILLGITDHKHPRWEYGHHVMVSLDGLDGALQLERQHRRARQYTGRTRKTYALTVPCPRCQAQALERDDGSNTIECTDCGRVFTLDEYEKLCLILADRWEDDLDACR